MKKTQLEKILLESLDVDPSIGKTLEYRDVICFFIQ